MQELLNGQRLVLGTCYYPEHWAKELWREDLQRMKKVGIEVIRIAEFAWSKVEPTEGCYDYAFFDEFLDLAQEEKMKVIFCTPTATPPAWLTEKYPEVLNVDKKGNLFRHGLRRHYNYNSPLYRQFSRQITEKIAAHYGKRECIIGWQLDNEFNCETDEFYSESDSLSFREFLKERYGSLNALNEAWGTVFWNQTYTAWEEIYVPRYTYNGTGNPHQALDYKRFISDSARRFAGEQSKIIRQYAKPGDFITTNGMFGNLDNHKLTGESLSFYCYDSYPNFAYCLDDYREDAEDLRDRKWSWNLSEVRSVSPVFGIMEQQSGANGWTTRMEAPTPRPGQMTLWTMQSIAHGADYVSYFRWRTCTVGTEIYWHGILDYSGRENRRLREVEEIHRKLQGMTDVSGSIYEAQVGILKDYDNIWDADIDLWHQRFDQQSQKSLFEAAQLTHTPIDYVYIDQGLQAEDLKKYKVLFYPHATILNRERVAVLKEYVAAGGILVVGCRSGYKDLNGRCVMDKLPGLLGELTGTDIPEYSMIAPDAGDVTINWKGQQLKAAVFTDLLEPVGDNAVLEAVYTSDYYAGAGALVRNSYGKGQAWYYGSAFNREAAEAFLRNFHVAEPYRDLVEAPACCELAMRRKGNKSFLFLLNYEKTPVSVMLKVPGKDLYTGRTVSGNLQMRGYETMVLDMEASAF